MRLLIEMAIAQLPISQKIIYREKSILHLVILRFVFIMNIWIDDTAKIDTNVATGEIMAIIYAIDPSLSSGADALELWGKLNQNSEVQQDGIAFDNYSFGNLVAVKAQYDGFEIQK